MKGACRVFVLSVCLMAIFIFLTIINSIYFNQPCDRSLVDSSGARPASPQQLIMPSGNCNCTVSYTETKVHLPLTPSMFCECKDPTVCPLPEVKVEVKEVVKEVIKSEKCPGTVPWYVEGKAWHYPARFPLCSMDACFNYSKCDNSKELLIYSYDVPSPPRRFFSHINESKYFTDDPEKACIFLVFLDADNPWPPHPSTLPYWNKGHNHVLVIFADKWAQKGPHQESVGLASVMASDIHETTYRAGFDISIPLPAKIHIRELQSVKSTLRKYLATFRGLRYLGARGEGVFRSHDSFRDMHNGNDVIVATTCNHPINNMNREKEPAIGVNCDEDELVYRNHTFNDLMNSTFALVPAGIQPASYRFIEVLSAGAIPVLIADNYVKPFDTLIQWYKCLLQFPTTEMHRIVGTLRSMQEEEILERQKNCLFIYNEYLKDDRTLLRSSVRALKQRFLGAIPSFVEANWRR